MAKFRISQIQFQADSTPLKNSKILIQLFIKSQKYKPDLICTPECSNIITNNKNFLLKNTPFLNDCPVLKMSKIFAKENKVNISIGSLLLKIPNHNKLVNRSIIINKQGKIQTFYDKINLFDVNINKKETHRESKYFKNGSKLIVTKVNGIDVGLTICYDLRFPNLYRSLTKMGAKIILIPSAFTVPSGKAHWETLTRARSIENSVFIVATNMCGTHHSKRKTYGHSVLFNPWGDVKNICKSSPKIINSEIDLKEINKVRNKIPSISQ